MSDTTVELAAIGGRRTGRHPDPRRHLPLGGPPGPKRSAPWSRTATGSSPSTAGATAVLWTATPTILRPLSRPATWRRRSICGTWRPRTWSACPTGRWSVSSWRWTQPERVLSLTLIEPTIFAWLRDDPDYGPWLRRFMELEDLAAAGAPHEEWLMPFLSLIDPDMATGLRPGSTAWPLMERAIVRQWMEERVSAYLPDDDLRPCARRPDPDRQRGQQRAGDAAGRGAAGGTPALRAARGAGRGGPPAPQPRTLRSSTNSWRPSWRAIRRVFSPG